MTMFLFYISILLLWWDGSNFVLIESPRISIFILFFAFTLIAIVIASLTGRRHIVKPTQLLPYGLLLVWILFTTLTAEFRSVAYLSLYSFFNRLMLCIATAWVITTTTEIRRVLKVIIFASIVSAGLMVLQYTLGIGFVNPRNVKRLVAGTSWRAAIVGFYMMVPMALMAAYAILGKGGKRVWAGILAVVFAMATLYSSTRSTFVGLMAVVFLLLNAKSGLGRIGSVVLGVVLVVIAGSLYTTVLPESLDRLLTKTEVAGEDIRMDFLWPKAWQMFKENPIIGTGPGGFYAQTGWSVHNSVLEMAAEMGVWGGLLYVIALALPFFYFRRAKKRLWRTRDGWIWVGLYCGYPGMVIGTVLHGFGGWMPSLWLLIGLGLATRNVAEREYEMEMAEARILAAEEEAGWSPPVGQPA